jgi:hypothetical protein
MTQASQKQTGHMSAFLRSIKHTYLPGPFRKVYAVAMILGSSIGGFFGGTVASGYHAMTWVIVLSTLIGMMLGMVFTLGIVPKKP